jgi:hypothetical protein
VLRLHGVAREAAGMEHQHNVKAVLHRVLDEPLEVGSLISEAAGLEVDVLLDQPHVVLGGVGRLLGVARRGSSRALAPRLTRGYTQQRGESALAQSCFYASLLAGALANSCAPLRRQ